MTRALLAPRRAAELGLVDSLNRPGGNITGYHLFFGRVAAKRLQLLQEFVPKAAVIGMVVNPAFPSAEQESKEVLAAAQTVGKQIHIATAKTEDELDSAFRELVRRKIDAVIIGTDAFFIGRRDKIVVLAAHY